MQLAVAVWLASDEPHPGERARVVDDVGRDVVDARADEPAEVIAVLGEELRLVSAGARRPSWWGVVALLERRVPRYADRVAWWGRLEDWHDDWVFDDDR